MPDAARFDLYSFWRSSATYRVRVALNLKGLAADEIDVDIDAGGQRGEAYLKINPLGQIPALVDGADGAGAVPVTQSLAILEYLDEIAPEPPLLPATPAARARVRSLALMLAADTHPLLTPRVRKVLVASAGFDDARWRAWQVRWFETGLQAFEQRLAGEAGTAAFCQGDSPTVADIVLASIVVMTRVFKIEVAGIPTIRRIMAECEQRDAFARADPSRQAGAPVSAGA